MISLALGLPGSGKSLLCHCLVKAQAASHLFFVSDHEAGWGPDSPLWIGGAPAVRIINAGESPENAFPPAGIIIFRNWRPEKVAKLAVDVGNVTYVDDELDKAGRRKGFDDSPLRDIINEGRHLPNKANLISEVHVIGACRRPQKLHADITDLADQFYLFRCKGSATLRRLQDDSLIEDSDWETLREMPKLEFLHWPSGEHLRVKT